MENKINVKIKQCYDTEENYKINNPVLLEGQLAYTKDKYGKYKIGDGISHWNDLDYTENIFIGTQKEYEEKNANGEIIPGTVVYITDDNDYCNIPIDTEMSEEDKDTLVYNRVITKALRLNNATDNTITPNISTAIAQTACSIPAAGSPDMGSLNSNLGGWIDSHRSGFYTLATSNGWYNVISNRHRNGLSDGTKYGIVLLSHLTNASADLIWDRQSNQSGEGKWQGQRTILDSANYSNLATTFNNNCTFKGTNTYIITTSTYINGAKGINVPINMTSGTTNSFNMFASVPSNNGRWFIGSYQDHFDVYFMNNTNINANTNSPTRTLILLNEAGDSTFPGLVTASQFKASGTAMNISAGLVTQVEVGTTRLFKNGIAISNPGTRSDQGWIRVTGSGEGDTVLEIATGDDGGAGEQIVVRQYNTSNAVARQAILLNTAGNTSFPGTVTAPTFSGSLSGNATSANKLAYRGNHTEAASGTAGNSPSTGVLDGQGLYLTGTYNDGNTPVAYGNIINIIGAGTGQLLCEWSGSDNTTGNIWYRSHRDTTGGGWGSWIRMLTTRDSSSFATSSHSHSRVDSTTYIGSGSASYIKQGGGSVTQVMGTGGLELFVNSTNNPWIQIKNSSNNLGIVVRYGGTHVTPGADNSEYLGESGTRWKQVYAVSSTISTSDRNYKKEISYIGENSEYDDTSLSYDKLIQLIMSLKPVVFKRTEGESGRPHHGFIAQDFEEVLHDLNIDHAAFIKSPVEEVKEIKDENGNVIDRERIIKDNEFIYGMRYEELVSDTIYFCQLLYKKNAVLEKQLQEKDKQINDLTNRLSSLEKKVNAILGN